MPEPGWRSLTIPEELYRKIKRLAKERNTTPPKLLRELIEKLEGRPERGQGLATASPPLGRGKEVAAVKEEGKA